MAGAEFKLTDAISGSIFEKLEKLSDYLSILDDDFKRTSKNYADLAKNLSVKLNINPKSLDDLDKKSKEYEKTVKQLHDTQNQLSDLQDKYKATLKEVNEITKQAVVNAQNDAKAKKINADAELQLQKAQTERLRQQKMLNQEQRKQKVTIEEAIRLTKVQVQSIREAETQNKKLRQAVADITDAEDKDGKIRTQLNSTINQNTNYIKRNRDALVQNKMTVGEYREQVKLAMIELKNGNNTMQNFGVVARGFGGILSNSVSNGLNQVTIGVGSMIKGMVGAQAVIGAIQRLFSLFKEGVQTAIDFEAANSKLAAVLGTTSKNTKELQKDARELGATTKYTAAEATNLQIELAKLGFTAKEIKDSTKYILLFAQATGAELPEAAALSGAALRMFNADTEETERYVSAMAVATAKSALSFSYLATALPIVGPVANSFNFTIEDTLALLGKLSDAGFDASSAATATRNIMLNLADSSGKLAKALGKPVTSLPELVEGLRILKDRGIDLNETLELTDKRSVAAFNAFLTAADKIIPLRDQITGVSKELGDMANTMSDNTAGAIKTLSSAWDELMISIMGNTGAVRAFIEATTDGVKAITQLLKSVDTLSEEDIDKAMKIGEESVDNESLKRHIDLVNSAKDSYIKLGISEVEALEKAKEERISILSAQLDEEKKIRDKARSDNLKALEKYENASFFKQGLGLEKSNDELRKDADDFWYAYLSGVSYVSSIEKQIEELANISIETIEDTKTKTKELTEEEKRELEKLRNEQIAIDKGYQDSKLELMDNGLEKELESIRLNYTRRIAEVSGYSEKENETRKNLAEKMQQELNNKEISYYLDNEKKKAELSLSSVEKNSKAEQDIKLMLIDLEYEAEVNALNGNFENLELINAKYLKKRQETEEQYANARIKTMQESYSTQSMMAAQSMIAEEEELSVLYAGGLINKEEYENKKTSIQEKYAIKSLQIARDNLQEMLDIEGDNLSSEDKASLEEKLAEASIALSNKEAEIRIDNNKKIGDSEEEKLEKIAKGLRMAGDFLNAFADLSSAIYEGRIQKVEEEQEANEEAGEKELERIDMLEKNGSITKEEAEARKRASIDKTNRKEEELAKKKAELQTKQAKFEKANNIAQTIIATSLAVAKALPNLVLAGLAAAMGAIQLATIIATPLPKYAKGTPEGGHGGGLAIVGDGGRKETIFTGNGAYITPDTPTLVDLPKGAHVIPHEVDLRKFMAVYSDYDLLMHERREKNLPPITINNNFSDLEKKFDKLERAQLKGFKSLERAIKNNSYQQFSKNI